MMRFRIPARLLALLLALPLAGTSFAEQEAATPPELAALFAEWRAFERPPLVNGVPDYTAETTAARHVALKEMRQRLEAMDRSGWPVEHEVDWQLVKAEMNGLDFDIRVLKPWVRDPAYYQSIWTYQSDTPAHEGPTNHAVIELWMYEFPLSGEREVALAAEIETIPPLLAQARQNLTGNAEELWVGGIGAFRDQVRDLKALEERTSEAGNALREAIVDAIAATESFVSWLEAEAPKKDGPSGIGIENYNWYLRHVHLVPLTWEDEVRLLTRELHRAHSSLQLEAHRNRNLPEIVPIASPEEYVARTDAAVRKYVAFLHDNDIIEPKAYHVPSLLERTGRFIPEAERNFFWRAVHLEPMTLWTHFYHWWDLARIEVNPHPSPIRRGALLSNIFDSRAEGLSTGIEELAMHMGLYDDNPRAREIVWIMLAQRAARGLGSLYAHANRFTLKEARDFHVRWTPRGWMREDLDLLGFEQLLYLRQPGYGTSYITGKYLIEQLMSERAEQLRGNFDMKGFFADVDAAGVVPVSMIRWQLIGQSPFEGAVPGPDFSDMHE